ncbi:hypothetical protein HC744_05675 [Arthrobacter sp. S1_S22]|uniref:hypothetical protein n=1 Tax=Pseudarthrobacter sp. NKDBFgelt TaxID=3384443 RepID=UPI001684B27F|nr:hypothetical protein [Arthrobacter sp. S1_S22]
MGKDIIGPDDEAVPGTGVNDHAWEREHRHPTPEQARSIGYRRRDAEAKLEQHQQEAREKAEHAEEQDTPDKDTNQKDTKEEGG